MENSSNTATNLSSESVSTNDYAYPSSNSIPAALPKTTSSQNLTTASSGQSSVARLFSPFQIASKLWSSNTSTAPSSRVQPISENSNTDREYEDLALGHDIICFSHLRWDFVFQRPQHFLTRFSKHQTVYFIEEPIYHAKHSFKLQISSREPNVIVVTPHLSESDRPNSVTIIQQLVGEALESQINAGAIFWYYTPMAMAFSDSWPRALTVYDCMDELSAFNGAPPELLEFEKSLFAEADIVFTGGQSLYEVKKHKHEYVHAMPSSIDRAHFAQALQKPEEPRDQIAIKGTKIGFYGVIDERLDIKLLDSVAALRPDWQIVILGPVVKIRHEDLPMRPNIHYLGQKSYAELPSYLAHWDVATLPFALNESTKFISPTKTPEYLAGGKTVVSTAITDVIRPYGELGLVHIAESNGEDFVSKIEVALAQRNDPFWAQRVDGFLSRQSWDKTWRRMNSLMRHLVDLQKSAIPAATTGMVSALDGSEV